MIRHELEIASLSDAGLVRPFNEDSIAVDATLGIAAVADGMGERRGADMASRLATTRLLQLLRERADSAPDRAVREAFAAVNAAICREAQDNPGMQGMATTLVAAWFRGDRVSIAHVGDSRLYRFRDGHLERLTIDHSFVQEQLVAGTLTDEEARQSQSRHLVTRALGTEEAVAPDLSEHEVRAGDLYLLCSDGLHDLVDDADIALTLETLHPNLDLAASTLIALANDRGGADNISVVLVKARAPNAAPTSRAASQPQRGLLGWLRQLFRT